MKGFETKVLCRPPELRHQTEEHRPAMKGFETPVSAQDAHDVLLTEEHRPAMKGFETPFNYVIVTDSATQRNIAPR